MLNAAFCEKGHSVALAANGDEAVQAARQQLFDAAILDTKMPLMDGWEATRTIRKIPEYSTIPIILFTDLHQRYDEPKAIQAGATILLHKPFDPLTIVALTVAYVLTDREAD